MLTIKQSQLLNYLIKKIEDSGTSPSYEEICIHLNLKSKSGIHRIVQGLLERDYILKLNNKARSIYPKKYPNGKIYSTLKQDQDNEKPNNTNTLNISLMAKFNFSLIAIGVINFTLNLASSPGITISVPEGNSTSPVTSVVLK